ncbi:MAG: hypothetical protein EOP35_02265 [Rubrivivax sp.]|nr:MAG: hypothetical protein EOP35_02265 [Rubrivivax sp.]
METHMGHSSLVGTEKAPLRPQGRDEDALGPSDISDSGSDMVGAGSLPGADPGEPVDVTLNRDQAVAPIEGKSEDSDETEAADIGVDRISATPDGAPLDDEGDLEAIDRDLVDEDDPS